MVIPFNKPCVTGAEQAYVAEAIAGNHLSGDGPFSRRCHELLQREVKVRRALLTTSCTDALEMTALLLQVGPGDEVIIPSFTFVSTANAFALRGAHPVFVDIRPDTLNLDESQIERKVTDRTRAIVVVHYAGVGCEMDTIQAIAARYHLPIVEDNAHGLFGRYRGHPLGSIGALAAQSFHETKNFTCGEGGALLLNDETYEARAEILREKGTNRSRFFRGEVDKYTWVDLGSSFLPSDMCAAYLFAQLERREAIQARRRLLWENYATGLTDWACRVGARLPFVPSHCDQAFHMFYLLLPSLAVRQKLIAHLKSRSIHAVFHYLPLHLSEMGRSFGGSPGDCPVTEDVSDRLLRLPLFYQLTDDEQGQVIEAIRKFS